MVYNQTFHRGVDEVGGNGENYLKWGGQWRVPLKILPQNILKYRAGKWKHCSLGARDIQEITNPQDSLKR